MSNSFTVKPGVAQKLEGRDETLKKEIPREKLNQRMARGALNFWKLQGAELDEALGQLSDAQIRKIKTNLLHNN